MNKFIPDFQYSIAFYVASAIFIELAPKVAKVWDICTTIPHLFWGHLREPT